MKRSLLVLVLLFLLLQSCSDPINEYNIIQKHFPYSQVYKVPNRLSQYIVTDTLGGVYYVECMNKTNDSISGINIIKHPRK